MFRRLILCNKLVHGVNVFESKVDDHSVLHDSVFQIILL